MNRVHRIKATVLVAVFAILLTGCQMANPKEKEELVYRKAGIVLLEKGEYKKAATTFQKALDCSNGRISDIELDICYYKAMALAKEGKNKKALEVYNAIISYDDKQWQAYLQRGNLYASMEEYDKACKDYNQATKLKDNDYELCIAAYENLKESMAAQEIAEAYLHKALNYKESSGVDYREKGRIYLILKEYDKAKQYLSQAQNEGDEEAKLYMAQVFEASGDSKAAYSIYESYADAHKEDGDAQLKLVNLLMEEESYDKAVKYIATAKKTISEENKKQLLTCEIAAQERLGNFEQAKSLLEVYVEEYPKDKKAEKELKFVTGCAKNNRESKGQ